MIVPPLFGDGDVAGQLPPWVTLPRAAFTPVAREVAADREVDPADPSGQRVATP